MIHPHSALPGTVVVRGGEGLTRMGATDRHSCHVAGRQFVPVGVLVTRSEQCPPGLSVNFQMLGFCFSKGCLS